MKKTIIFDIDGTLIDSTRMHAEAWREAFRQFGYNFEVSELISHIGRGDRGLVIDFVGAKEYERIGKQIASKHQGTFAHLGEAKPFPMVKELFAELRRRGKTILLASSAARQTVEKHIRLLSVQDWIDGKVSGSDVTLGKPAPDIFHTALTMVSAKPEESAVVGDSVWDVEAAKNAGIDSVAVLTGGVPAELLRKSGAKEIYRDIAELHRNLDKSLLR
jgi:HAD superfamily hydrolase (TIGR01509 family)